MVEKIPDPDPHKRNQVFFTQRPILENRSGMFIPDL
jgi:hypothetical protein